MLLAVRGWFCGTTEVRPTLAPRNEAEIVLERFNRAMPRAAELDPAYDWCDAKVAKLE